MKKRETKKWDRMDDFIVRKCYAYNAEGREYFFKLKPAAILDVDHDNGAALDAEYRELKRRHPDLNTWIHVDVRVHRHVFLGYRDLEKEPRIAGGLR